MIRIEHLTKRFGTFVAVNDLSLEVQTGQVFAFLGPNGSGKTTTMKCIAGLNVPTSGHVLIDGMDVRLDPRKSRSLLSYLPQRVVFPDNLTAREIMRFFADLRGVDRACADRVLTAAQFNGFSDKYVGTFSGGMIQRLGLAVVSLPDAPILLLDEPTASLDPLGVKRFREFVVEQKRKGKTVIFSTHLLAEAEQLADRVGIMVGGSLAAVESVSNLRSTFLKNGTIEDMYLHYIGRPDDEIS